MKVGFVTCRVLPEPDADEVLLLETAARMGIDATLGAWDDPNFDPSNQDLLVLRSTWNYHLNWQGFLDWVNTASESTPVLNPPSAIRWNVDKRYLSELRARSIPVVPTRFSAEKAELLDLWGEWDHIVVKPSVSAGSFRTRTFDRSQSAQAQQFALTILDHSSVMVQPFMESVHTVGERSVIWIGGEPTHAIRKNPRFEGQEECVSAALTVSEEEARLSQTALECVPGPLVYARIDFMFDEHGEPLISEVEVVEPSLFLLQNPQAAERLIESILAYGQ